MRFKFLENFSLKKLLYNKRFTIPFSILVAFTFWMVITINQKPVINRTFTDITVTVNLENSPNENSLRVIGDISEQKFTVSLKGPSYLISSLTSSNLSLYASTASVDTPGEYTLDVALLRDAVTSECEVLSIFPSKITLDFDYFEEKTVSLSDIKVSAEGITPTDDELDIGDTVVTAENTESLVISGPRTTINKIDKVVASVTENKSISKTENFNAKIVLYNSDGDEINQKNLEFSTKDLTVTVPIIKQKTVSVVPEFTGLPLDFNKSSIGYTIDYPSVTIVGKPEAVDSIDVLTLSAIDLTNVTPTTTSFDVSPKIQVDNVKLLDEIDHFTVKLNLKNYSEKTLDITNAVKFTGLSGGLSASSTTTIKNVRICGPRAAVNKINASMVTAQVDLSGKKAGQYTVDVTFKIAGYNNAWVIGTYKAVVTVK